MWGVLLLLSAVVPKVFVPVEGTTAFNCRNSLISDEWRQYVLDEVNAYRRSLALGEVYDKTKKFLPMAKNMNELNWDCNLEEMAYKGTLGDCTVPAVNYFAPYQSMQAGIPKKDCNITSQTKRLLYIWWKEIKNDTVKYVNNGEPSIPKAPQFTLMGTAATTGFGCTYDFCNKKNYWVMVCIFDDKTNVSVANRVIYQPAADLSQVCEACNKNCTEYLCPQPHTPVFIPSTCKVDNLSNDAGDTALWMHNYYRRLLASGWAKDPKAKSGYAPPAKHMKKLEYDCPSTGTNVAAETYNAIKSCPPADPNATPGYSMNFLRINNYNFSQQDALKQAIKKWWGELGEKGLGDDTTFHDNSGIKSFANMAYDQADKFACAVQNCQQSGQTLVACQYNAVIHADDKIYETGKVCSGCRRLKPTRKCSHPAGLCE
ncbi:hypothetical protein Aduo_019477 [Ancylostoma duodenale]